MPTQPLNIKVHGAILAGGRSTRMGRDKRFLEIGGQFAIDRTVQLLRSWISRFQGELVICGLVDGYDCLADAFPGRGPLGGLESGVSKFLSTETSPWLLVAPVDMPMLSTRVLDELVRPIIYDSKKHASAEFVRFEGFELPTLFKLTIRLKYAVGALLSHPEYRERSCRNLLALLRGIEVPTNGGILERLENVNTPDDWTRVRKSL